MPSNCLSRAFRFCSLLLLRERSLNVPANISSCFAAIFANLSLYFNGELSNVRARIGSVSNETRGIWAGGQEPSYVNTIEYRAIASEGIVADFGNLSANRGYMGCLSSSTRGVFAGGYSPSPTNNVNVMEYVEITTIGDAVDFGDLANNVWAVSARLFRSRPFRPCKPPFTICVIILSQPK